MHEPSARMWKGVVTLDNKALESFNQLVTEMCSPPIQALPVADRTYSIDINDSPEQIGVPLFQDDIEGRRRSVGF